MRRFVSDDVRDNLTTFVADVISRFEPLEVSSSWGSAVILPERYFDDMGPSAHMILADSTYDSPRSDAAAYSRKWDSVSELLDSDTGSWRVRIGDATFVMDLDGRNIVGPKRPASAPSQVQPQHLVRVIRCRRGEPARWLVSTQESSTGSHKHFSPGIVSNITRLSDHPRLTVGQESGRPSRVHTHRAEEPQRTLTLDQLSLEFDDRLADVASRFDHLKIATSQGGALVIPLDHFRTVVDLAAIAVELHGAPDRRPDVGSILMEGEQIVELLDSDTGGWDVVTTSGEYIVDMKKRTVQSVPSPDRMAIPAGPILPLYRLERCRVGLEFVWTIGGNMSEPELARTAPDERVKSITRLDDWLVS